MIRPFTPDDIDNLLDVWEAASRIAHAFLPEEFFATERRAIVDEWLPRAETVVYEVEGRVVGFLSLVGDEVGAIFVHPARQGRGVGRALMDHARARRATLELEVFEENAIGRRFYDRYGFVEVSRGVHEPTGHAALRLRLES